ncbi:uncharacterized protein LOC135936170 [Cloeon dipterum]|uniref:uncharacterized protein LOC135936170 n=1 Tax=Cloeon dipterum TaxID=197152 RepID=UPI00321F66F3
MNARFHFRREMNLNDVMTESLFDWEVVIPRVNLIFKSTCYVCLVKSADVIVQCGHAACLLCFLRALTKACMMCRFEYKFCYLLPGSLAELPEPVEENVDNTPLVLDTDHMGFRRDRLEVGARLMIHLRDISVNPPPQHVTVEQIMEVRRKIFHNNPIPNASLHEDFGCLNMARYTPAVITKNTNAILNSARVKAGDKFHHINMQAYAKIFQEPRTVALTDYEEFMYRVTFKNQFNPNRRQLMQQSAKMAFNNYLRYLDVNDEVIEIEDGEILDDEPMGAQDANDEPSAAVDLRCEPSSSGACPPSDREEQVCEAGPSGLQKEVGASDLQKLVKPDSTCLSDSPCMDESDGMCSTDDSGDEV